MMHEKGIWKPGISEIAKTLGYVRWVMAYGHKTQSFMKNGGQQKCLDKALLGCMPKKLR